MSFRRTSYQYAETLTESKQMSIGEELIEHFVKLDLKYFHDLSNGVYIRTPCQIANGTVFKLQKNNTLLYYRPIYKSEMIIDIGYCELCGRESGGQIVLNKPIKLGYCSYYNNAANTIIQWIKRVQMKKLDPKQFYLRKLEQLEQRWEQEYDSFANEWGIELTKIEKKYANDANLSFKIHTLEKIFDMKKHLLESEHRIRVLRLEAEL